MKVALTATQRGLTDHQKTEVRRLLEKWNASVLVHGGCIGGDDEADQIAFELGITRVVRPQNNVPGKSAVEKMRTRISRSSHLIILPAAPAPGRNIDIIRAGEKLIACPAQQQEIVRSGTWMTIRNGRRILGASNVWIIYP